MWQSLMRLLTGRKEMTMHNNDLSAARSMLAELAAELDAINARVAAGDATLHDHQRRAPCLAELQAAREACAALEDRQLRSAQRTEEDDFRQRVAACMEELAELYPRMVFCLADMERLANEAHGVPFSRATAPDSVADLFGGLPPAFAANVLRALRESAPDIDWDYSCAAPAAIRTKSKPPTRRPDRRVIQLGRQELPPGASGGIPLTGETWVGAPPETDLIVG
jgi:hypothetical protein